MSKKNSSYYNSLAQGLRDFGIKADPISEMVVVGVDYNQNQVSAFAQGRGMTAEDFIKSITSRIKVVKEVEEVVYENQYALDPVQEADQEDVSKVPADSVNIDDEPVKEYDKKKPGLNTKYK